MPKATLGTCNCHQKTIFPNPTFICIQNTGQGNILDINEPSDISQNPSRSRSTPSQQSQNAPPLTPVNTSLPSPDMETSSGKI